MVVFQLAKIRLKCQRSTQLCLELVLGPVLPGLTQTDFACPNEGDFGVFTHRMFLLVLFCILTSISREEAIEVFVVGST